MPEVLKNAFSENKAECCPTTETQVTKRGAKGKEKERKTSSGPGVQSSVWMGMDMPFKSANNWFVDPGRSNQVRQPGTSWPQTEPNILLGIVMPPQPSMAREWEGREQPPHMLAQLPNPGVSSQPQRLKSRVTPQANERQARHRDCRESGSSLSKPSSSDNKGNSSRSGRSRPSHNRQRRSRTPRP